MANIGNAGLKYSAFCFGKFEHLLRSSRGSISWRVTLCTLYEAVISIHNENKELPYLDNQVRDFFNRPYKVIFAESIVEKLVESIENKELKKVNLNKICIDIKLESIDFTE